MTLATLLLAGALILISVVTAVIARSQATTAVERFGRRFGLEVAPGMEQTIRATVQARRVGAPIGTVVGVTVATVLLLVFPGLQLLATWWCLFASYLLGSGVGATVAIFIAEGRRERGAVRVARTSAVTVADYVPPLQSGFGWACLGAAVLAFAGDVWLAVVDDAGYLSIVSGVLVVLAVGTLIADRIVARRTVARGALAGTPLELAWDDGLRSYALVNFNGLVALIPLYSLVAYNTLVATATKHMLPEPAYGVYVGLLPIAASVAIIAFVAIMSSINSRQHFLRRLWPSFAAQVAEDRAAKAAAESAQPTELMGSR